MSLRSRCTLLLALACLGPMMAPERTRASWVAEPDCISGARLVGSVERALGAPIREGITIEGDVGGEPGRWRARVRVRGGEDVLEREITSEVTECAGLDDAIVVVAAMLVDEAALTVPPSVLVAPEPNAVARVAAAPPAEDDDPFSLGLSVRLAGALRIDEVAGPSAVTGLEVELQIGSHVAILLGTHFVPPVEAGSPEGVSVRYAGAAARLGGCGGASLLEGLEMGGCGVGSLAYLSAEARGLTTTQVAEGVSLLFSLEAWARARLVGPLWVRLSAGLGVPLIRARTVYFRDGVPTPFHEAAWVVPEFGAGFELRVP